MESSLLVFVSSVITGMEEERKAAQAAIEESIHLTRSWLFEFSPASSLSLNESYLSKVRECDIFVLLLKDKLTDPVKTEVTTAQADAKPILVFLSTNAPRDVAAYAQLLGVRYAKFKDPNHLKGQVTEAVADELIREYRKHSISKEDSASIVNLLKSKRPKYLFAVVLLVIAIVVVLATRTPTETLTPTITLTASPTSTLTPTSTPECTRVQISRCLLLDLATGLDQKRCDPNGVFVLTHQDIDTLSRLSARAVFADPNPASDCCHWEEVIYGDSKPVDSSLGDCRFAFDLPGSDANIQLTFTVGGQKTDFIIKIPGE
ncbi:MAG: DUF4062 domain-containing protein [Chloroflexi bacterium]|nr:DUF4062 domain-containing protein [Chloroflexota bacterium]